MRKTQKGNMKVQLMKDVNGLDGDRVDMIQVGMDLPVEVILDGHHQCMVNTVLVGLELENISSLLLMG